MSLNESLIICLTCSAANRRRPPAKQEAGKLREMHISYAQLVTDGITIDHSGIKKRRAGRMYIEMLRVYKQINAAFLGLIKLVNNI